ncbi:four helix bundle protein [Maribacter vaceletii]|uniref:Four helix bundle protein n=1 Tax=Maribacter vaceletii TaxID=1206816 RepID=A0A495DVZ5_9FLAO|nr:four helix bundle protein [Maribacter vaceletii]RKR07767.1 four helix bundle protein [Maribacter vaceletii]
MDYKELDIWVQARKLVKSVYVFPKDEQYGLTSQIRRCAISVSSNIAEGCGRRTSADTIRFLHINKGSLYELETQLILVNDLEFLESDINIILKEVERVKKLLSGFINYQRKIG